MDDQLSVFATTSAGTIFYTTRYSAGNWEPSPAFDDPFGRAPFFTEAYGSTLTMAVAAEPLALALGRTSRIHLLKVTGNGGLLYASGLGNRFGSFELVAPTPNLNERVLRVAAAVHSRIETAPRPDDPDFLVSALHVCVITTAGQLAHIVRTGAGTWRPAIFHEWVHNGRSQGDFMRVALSGTTYRTEADLHLCAVTADGRLWHALRRTASDPSGGEWTDIGDVRQQAGNHGDVIDVSCARTGGDTLRVCAVTGDGHIWHTRRYPDTWTPFDDIEFFRFPGGQVGRDIGTLHSAALGVVSNGTSDVCTITTNGRIWHTRIGDDGIPQRGFRNIQTELGVGDFGTVRSISVC